MALRRTLQRRVYVEDALPAFLTSGRTPASAPSETMLGRPVSASLPQFTPAPGAIHNAGKHGPLPAQQASETGRALMVLKPSPKRGMDGWFLLQVTTLAIALNVALTFLLAPTDAANLSERLNLQLNVLATQEPADTLEERVGTFSRTASFVTGDQ